jgi:hypothetical protein
MLFRASVVFVVLAFSLFFAATQVRAGEGPALECEDQLSGLLG